MLIFKRIYTAFMLCSIASLLLLLLILPSGRMHSFLLLQTRRMHLIPPYYFTTNSFCRLLSPKGPPPRPLQLGESLLYYYKIQWIPSLLLVLYIYCYITNHIIFTFSLVDPTSWPICARGS